MANRNLLYFAALTFLVILLWWGGAQPFAVGLFPPPYDKFAHFAFFGTLTFLLWQVLGRRLQIVVFILVCCIGALDEWRQVFLPGRSAGLDDWAADMLAAFVVVAVMRRRQEGKE